MSQSVAPVHRGRGLAEIADVRPVAILAAIGGLAGIWWFPLWFLSAQLLRIWAMHGGMRWLTAHGVAEYADEKIAMLVGLVPVAIIAARIILSVDWVQPFRILETHKVTSSAGELSIFLDLVVGIAMATAFTGVLVTRGLPWLVAALGFAAVLVLAAAATRGYLGEMSGFTAMPLALLGYLTTKIAIIWDNHNNRPDDYGPKEEPGPRPDDLHWTNVSRTKR